MLTSEQIAEALGAAKKFSHQDGMQAWEACVNQFINSLESRDACFDPFRFRLVIKRISG